MSEIYDIYEDLTKMAENASILVVEDSEEVSTELYELFVMFFKKVDRAFDGQEGLLKAKEFKFDVILTDLEMPILNGVEMIEEIQKIHKNQQIVALSGYIDDYLSELEKLGIKHYLEKPYYVNNLFSSIIDCLKNKEEN